MTEAVCVNLSRKIEWKEYVWLQGRIQKIQSLAETEKDLGYN